MDRMAAMEAFVLVVDTGSFSAAARRLNVGQPAVSKMVAQLEDRLGVKLLVRTTRGLTATEAGLNYYERARRSIEEADEAELDPSDYSVESLRRTKALHILKGTGDLQTVRALLGHSRIESTARFLGLETKADPIEVCRAFDI
jgi:DNA-binding transcriptional LysR family regulator